MLFSTSYFAFFFPIVFACYWFVFNRNIKIQNGLLLSSSYFFYACWDWRFVFLLMFSTFLDYFIGLKIFKSKQLKTKKIWFWVSIIINLGFLGVFKYFNFFSESFSALFSKVGFTVDPITINVILPIGISFYTFHGLSYIIDVFNNKIKPEENIVDYSLFVCYFPLLVAGPIERATHLLPQIKSSRKFNFANSIDGLRQILWGLFKKIVIADNCFELVNLVFDNPMYYSSITLIVGAILFAFQIYCDFSGYSDIALGISRLLGIELLRNFDFPYFSRDIAEFWRKWHISLSSWFKDYVYIPLGGSKGGSWNKVRNIFIIFLLSGFWHGANWTFLVWGFLNAVYYLPILFFNKNRAHISVVASGKLLPNLKEFLLIVFTFALSVFAWIFFRAENIGDAFEYINGIFSFNDSYKLTFPNSFNGMKVSFFLISFVLIEWLGREGKHALERIENILNKPIRLFFYYCLIFAIIWFGGKEQQFIYFQF